MNFSILPWMCPTVKLKQMVRPFTLRDFALVRRLSEQGVSLHAESALADSLHPLRGALRNMVVSGDFPTFVWRSEERNLVGFIQILLEEERHHAHILFLSPTITVAEPLTNEIGSHDGQNEEADIWLPLLDQAVIEVGQHGVHSLVAEVDELGPELPILRRAGFVVYTRQDIWLLEESIEPAVNRETNHDIRIRQADDDWDIQLLYANTVPRLVQLVEPVPPAAKDKGWVLRDDKDELTAFVHLYEGAVASWYRFFLHPKVEHDAESIVQSALLLVEVNRQRPVYCCVRRYEGWLTTALQKSGFQLWGSQAVLVKHTVHHQQRAQPKLAIALENGSMPVSSPYVRRFNDRDGEHSNPD